MIAIGIHAVGRLRAGPELALVSDYLDRATRTGRGVGLGPVTVTEIDDRKANGPAAEAAALAAGIGAGAFVVAMDERGQMLSSPDLAQRIAALRDAGRRELAFVIGGADGLAPGFCADADLTVSFGRMVWPHMLARAMLAEQIYRATTILAGSPYHRV